MKERTGRGTSRSIAAKFEALCDKVALLLESRTGALFWVIGLLLYQFLGSLAADPDLFARVAVGRLIELNQFVTDQDPFAFTPKTARWIDHEWLSGYLFYYSASYGQDLGLFFLKILFVLGALHFMLRARQAYDGSSGAGFLWFALVAHGSAYVWSSTIRAQVITYLMIPLLFCLLLEYQKSRGRWRLLLAALLFVPWANSHGGFVVGLGFLGIFFINGFLVDRRNCVAYGLTLTAAVLATLINPYGLDYWRYILDAVTMVRPGIVEWDIVNPLSREAIINNLLVVGIFYGIWRSGLRGEPLPLLILAVSTYFGYRHDRLSAILYISAYIFGSRYLNVTLASLHSYSAELFLSVRRAASFVAVILFVGFFSRIVPFLSDLRGFSLDYSSYPVKACEWLRANGSGNLLVGFNIGSYALWRVYPALRISVDGRYEELYPQSTIDLVSRALSPLDSGHQAAIEELDPDFILLDAKLKISEFGSKWNLVYNDGQYQVIARTLVESKSVPEVVDIWSPVF